MDSDLRIRPRAHPSGRHAVRACTLLGCFALLFASAAIGAAYAGKQINSTLDDLRHQGVTFIYNTDLIPDSLLVQTEPAARAPVEVAREILSPYGLILTQVAPRMFAVVRASPAVRPQTSGNDPPPQRVEEVVVHASRYALAQSLDASHTFLDQVQVTNLPRLGDETLQAVQRLPGAAVNGFSSIGPIRGGIANETAIVLDGLRLYEPFHLKSYLSPVSLLDSRIIDGIDVYFGGFPAVYGDRMSAMTTFSARRPPSRQFSRASADPLSRLDPATAANPMCSPAALRPTTDSPFSATLIFCSTGNSIGSSLQRASRGAAR